MRKEIYAVCLFASLSIASHSLRGSINGKRILCRFNPKIGRFSCILIIIAINRAIMDHQTGAAGQRPQKLTAKIERIGRWVEEKVSEVEEYRNTAGNRSQPATVCRPRPRPSLRVSKRICPPIIGPVTTARWPLTQACQSQKSSQPPPF